MSHALIKANGSIYCYVLFFMLELCCIHCVHAGGTQYVDYRWHIAQQLYNQGSRNEWIGGLLVIEHL